MVYFRGSLVSQLLLKLAMELEGQNKRLRSEKRIQTITVEKNNFF